MRTDELPVALLAFLAFVVITPIWLRWLERFQAATPSGGIIAALVLPAAALLFITSWMSPELARLALGGLLLVCVMVMAPWFWRFNEMLAAALVDEPFAQILLRAALPIIVVMFLLSMGKRRLAQ